MDPGTARRLLPNTKKGRLVRAALPLSDRGPITRSLTRYAP